MTAQSTRSHFPGMDVLTSVLDDPMMQDYTTLINLFEEYKEQPNLLDSIIPTTVPTLSSLITNHITTLMSHIDELIHALFTSQLDHHSTNQPQLTTELRSRFATDFQSSLLHLQRICQIFYTLIKVRKLKYVLKFVSPGPQLLNPLLSFLILLSSPIIESTLTKLVIRQSPQAHREIHDTTPQLRPIPTAISSIFQLILGSFQNTLQWHVCYSLLVLLSTTVLTPFPLHTFDAIASKYSTTQLSQIASALLPRLIPAQSTPQSTTLPPPSPNPPASLLFFTLPLPIRAYSLLIITISSPSTLQQTSALTLGRMLSRPDFIMRFAQLETKTYVDANNPVQNNSTTPTTTPPASPTTATARLNRHHNPVQTENVIEPARYPTIKEFCDFTSAILNSSSLSNLSSSNLSHSQSTSDNSPLASIPIALHHIAVFNHPHTPNQPANSSSTQLQNQQLNQTQQPNQPNFNTLDSFPYYASGCLLTMSTLLQQIKLPTTVPTQSKSTEQNNPTTQSPQVNSHQPPLLTTLTSCLSPILIDIPSLAFLPQTKLKKEETRFKPRPQGAPNTSPITTTTPTPAPTPSVRQIPGLLGSLLRGLPLDTQNQCLTTLTNPSTNQLPTSLHTPASSPPTSTKPNQTPIWLSNQSTKSLKLWVKTLKRFTVLLLSQTNQQLFSIPTSPQLSQLSTMSQLSPGTDLKSNPLTSTTSPSSNPLQTEPNLLPSQSPTYSQLQSIIQLFFYMLRDESWAIRWSAAKGIGLIVQRLAFLSTSNNNHNTRVAKPIAPQQLNDDKINTNTARSPSSSDFQTHFLRTIATTMIDMLISLGFRALLQQEGNTLTGVLLSLSELLRTHQIPLHTLLSFIELILLSLWYPIQQTSLNTNNIWAPTLIRECACLAVYTLARGYSFHDLQRMVAMHNSTQYRLQQQQQPQRHQHDSSNLNDLPLTTSYTTISNLILTIYDSLLIVCFLDPEKNVRCAASASLQEFIGRYYHDFSTYQHFYEDFILLRELNTINLNPNSTQVRSFEHSQTRRNDALLSTPSSDQHENTPLHSHCSPYFHILSQDNTSFTFQTDLALLRQYIRLQLHSHQATFHITLKQCPTPLFPRFKKSSPNQQQQQRRHLSPFHFLTTTSSSITATTSTTPIPQEPLETSLNLANNSTPILNSQHPLYITHFHTSALEMLGEFDLTAEIQLNHPQSHLYPPQSHSQYIYAHNSSTSLDQQYNQHSSHQNNPYQILTTHLHTLLSSSPHYAIPVLYFAWYRFFPDPQQSTRSFSKFLFSLLYSHPSTSQLLYTFLQPNVQTSPQSQDSQQPPQQQSPPTSLLHNHPQRSLTTTPTLSRPSWLQLCLDTTDPSPFHLESKISLLSSFLHNTSINFRSHIFRSTQPLSTHLLQLFLQHPHNYLSALSNAPLSHLTANPPTPPRSHSAATSPSSPRPKSSKLAQQTNWLTLRAQLLTYMSSLLAYLDMLASSLNSTQSQFLKQNRASTNTANSPSSPLPPTLNRSLHFYFNIAITFLSNHNTHIQALAANLLVKIHSFYISHSSHLFSSDPALASSHTAHTSTSTPTSLHQWLQHWVKYIAYRISPAITYLSTKLASPLPQSQPPHSVIDDFFHISRNSPVRSQNGFKPIQPQLPQFKLQDIPGFTSLAPKKVNTAPSSSVHSCAPHPTQAPPATNRFNRFKPAPSVAAPPQSLVPTQGIQQNEPKLHSNPQNSQNAIPAPFFAHPSLFSISERTPSTIPPHFYEWIIFNGQLAQTTTQPDQIATKLILQLCSANHQYPFRNHLLNPVGMDNSAQFRDDAKISSLASAPGANANANANPNAKNQFNYAPYDLQGILRVIIQLVSQNTDQYNKINQLSSAGACSHNHNTYTTNFGLDTIPSLLPTLVLLLTHPSVISCVITRSLACTALAYILKTQTSSQSESLRFGAEEIDFADQINQLHSLSQLHSLCFLPEPSTSQPLASPLPSSMPTSTTQPKQQTQQPPPQPPLLDILPPYYIPALPTYQSTPTLLDLAIGSMTLNQFDISQPTLSTLPPYHSIHASLYSLFCIILSDLGGYTTPHEHNTQTDATQAKPAPLFKLNPTHLLYLITLALFHVQSTFPILRSLASQIVIAVAQIVCTSRSPSLITAHQSLDPVLVKTLQIVNTWVKYQRMAVMTSPNTNLQPSPSLPALKPHLNLHSTLEHLLWSAFIPSSGIPEQSPSSPHSLPDSISQSHPTPPFTLFEFSSTTSTSTSSSSSSSSLSSAIRPDSTQSQISNSNSNTLLYHKFLTTFTLHLANNPNHPLQIAFFSSFFANKPAIWASPQYLLTISNSPTNPHSTLLFNSLTTMANRSNQQSTQVSGLSFILLTEIIQSNQSLLPLLNATILTPLAQLYPFTTATLTVANQQQCNTLSGQFSHYFSQTSSTISMIYEYLINSTDSCEQHEQSSSSRQVFLQVLTDHANALAKVLRSIPLSKTPIITSLTSLLLSIIQCTALYALHTPMAQLQLSVLRALLTPLLQRLDSIKVQLQSSTVTSSAKTTYQRVQKTLIELVEAVLQRFSETVQTFAPTDQTWLECFHLNQLPQNSDTEPTSQSHLAILLTTNPKSLLNELSK